MSSAEHNEPSRGYSFEDRGYAPGDRALSLRPAARVSTDDTLRIICGRFRNGIIEKSPFRNLDVAGAMAQAGAPAFLYPGPSPFSPHSMKKESAQG